MVPRNTIDTSWCWSLNPTRVEFFSLLAKIRNKKRNELLRAPIRATDSVRVDEGRKGRGLLAIKKMPSEARTVGRGEAVRSKACSVAPDLSSPLAIGRRDERRGGDNERDGNEKRNEAWYDIYERGIYISY